MLKSLAGPTIKVVCLILFLEFIDFFLTNYASSLGLLLPAWMRLPNWFLTLKQLITLDKDGAIELLSVSASIAGAFLALYFTAVSVVISTVYAKVQGNVRSVILRDKVSNAYIFQVAIQGVVSLILLSLIAVGYLPSFLNLTLVILLGIASFFSFVQLGLRIFYFFDPTHLVNYLTPDLFDWVNKATSQGYGWLDPSFQNHYQEESFKLLVIYRNLVHLANREEHLQSDALLGLANHAFKVLDNYGRIKHKIPSDSKWFRTTYRHKNWLTASEIDMSLALNTGTSLRPEEIPDLLWFENQIEETITFTLDKLLQRKDLNNVCFFFNSAQITIHNLSNNFAIDESFKLFRAASPALRNNTRSTDLTGIESEEGFLKLNFALGLTDLYALSFIQILLGLSNALSRITVSLLSKSIEKFDWRNTQSIYQVSLPRPVISKIEAILKQINFEVSVEGHLITPLWHIQELVAISFIGFIDKVCAELLSEFDKAIVSEASSLVNEKRAIFAAQLIERGIENCNKFLYHFNAFKIYTEQLENLRKVKDIPCVIIDWENYFDRITEYRKTLIHSLAIATLDLAKLPKSEKMPDYFGHAYTVISNECFLALLTGHEEDFNKLFPIFFTSSFITRERVIDLTNDWNNQEAKISLITQPIIDLAEITGYAYLFSELDGKNFIDTVEKQWDKYFDLTPNPEDVAIFICRNLEIQDSPLLRFLRTNTRYEWEREFQNRLESLGLREDIFSGVFSYDNEEPEFVHPSRLIKEIVTGGISLYYKATDVFVVKYIMKKFDTANFEKFPRKARDLFRQLNKDAEDSDE
ncbi:MAG: hypothetical protein JSS81_10255 [Acidobacteria bacterium]|nr:hypothetical protein [Acidobacteriota bacterium]